MVDDDFIPCFKQADIVQFFDKPAYRTESTPDYIFVTCDPSGGGMSQLAICSGYFDEALNWVVSVRHDILNFTMVSIMFVLLKWNFSVFGMNSPSEKFTKWRKYDTS
jgi:hypothetical protein